MGLRDIGASLPPGFRFYPSDEELVCHYLCKKISNGTDNQFLKDTLVEIDLHTCEPWQLPEVAKLNSTEWYFFSFRDRKYATGFRTNRATTTGYWKATGKDRTVMDPGTRSVVGMRKTLVFYKNRAPNGIKTGWIMHEFRLENPHLPPKEDWVLCRVFHKAKGENVMNSGEKLSPAYLYDGTAAGTTSPTLTTSPPADSTFAAAATAGVLRGYHHSPPQRSENANNSSSPLDRNYLQLCHHQVINHEILPHSKTEDEQYEFLFDMTFGESNLRDGHGISSNLDEMQFDDGNSMIFF